MARITVEDCMDKVENRFELVHLAAKRAKQLVKGSRPMVKSSNREVVTSLREIAAGRSLFRKETRARRERDPVPALQFRSLILKILSFVHPTLFHWPESWPASRSWRA